MINHPNGDELLANARTEAELIAARRVTYLTQQRDDYNLARMREIVERCKPPMTFRKRLNALIDGVLDKFGLIWIR